MTNKNWLTGIGERKWLWLLCLVCVIIVSCSLGSSALFEPDEGRNAEKAREILLLGDWVTPHENFLPTLDKPIFFYWLVAISFKLVGLSEWSARLPSALTALGCIVLVYQFCRRQWGVWEALWSALILVTSLEFALFSRFVIFDMTLTFFITSSLFSFYAATETDHPRSEKIHCLLMYAAMAVGTLVKGPIALVVPSIIIFFYLSLTHKWSLLRRLNIGTDGRRREIQAICGIFYGKKMFSATSRRILAAPRPGITISWLSGWDSYRGAFSSPWPPPIFGNEHLPTQIYFWSCGQSSLLHSFPRRMLSCRIISCRSIPRWRS